MTLFSLFRHPWDATGSGAAKSLQKAMGTTSLGLWDVLLRETLQNSWDARLDERIAFRVADTLLSEMQTQVLVHDIFHELPPRGASRKLPAAVRGGRLRVLTIADEGTTGLGGPIRANLAPLEGERADFADFVRNFGRDDEKGLKGGTYGYGKGVLYQASSVGVCLVYSQAVVRGSIEYRLIGVSGGDPGYVDAGYKYTGRNWWGFISDDGVVDPLVGIDARRIAVSAGMPVPPEGHTGTSIMVLSPVQVQGEDEDEDQDENARINDIRAAALKWAWPHAVDLGDGPNVLFSFSFDGSDLPPVEPFKDPMVRHFAQAYADGERYVHGRIMPLSHQTRVETIMSERPRQRLGILSMRQALGNPSDDNQLENCVALMRSPRIVVKYLSVMTPPDDYSIYSVFRADDDVDGDFASSEPVTHDDWSVKDARTRGRHNFVRIALSKIQATFRNIYGSSSADTTGAQKVAGATRIAAALGGIVGGISGTGTASQSLLPPGSTPPGGGGVSRRASARLSEPPRLLSVDGARHVAFVYRIHGGKNGEVFDLSATGRVVTVYGAEVDAPLDAELPVFVGWKVNGELIRAGTLRISTPTSDVYSAVFTQPNETAVTASVVLEAVSV